MEVLKQPRFWLLAWGAIGVAAVLYFLVAASNAPREVRPLSALEHDRALLTGAMAKFEYAFPPRPAPQIPFSHNGKRVDLGDFRGKTILVNFWATWCAPCLKELPSLDALEAEMGGKNFKVVAIAADPRGPEAAQAFFDRINIKNLDLYADPQLAIASSVGGANALPVSILYGPDGNEIGRLVGEADWNSAEARALVESAIR